MMNYWRVKNGVALVSALVTLRDQAGVTTARRFMPLIDMTYHISVADLLDRPEQDFIGSIEVEIHAAEDIKFAFPAVNVVYESRHGLSYVHTCQRIFNDVADARRGIAFNPKQSAFDILSNSKTKPYAMLINGPTSVRDAAAELKLFNHLGETRAASIPLGTLPPYAARMLDLDVIPGLDAFLAGHPGFCKLDVNLEDIFCRFSCGNIAEDQSTISVTHSFYDCEHLDDYYKAENGIQQSCFMPFNMPEGVDAELVLYPILSPATLKLTLDCYNQNGTILGRHPVSDAFVGSGTRMIRINPRHLLATTGSRTPKDSLYVVRIEANGQKLPARIPVGLNYRTATSCGVNINTSALFTSSLNVKARSYMWGLLPQRPKARNWIMLSYIATKEESSAKGILRFFSGTSVIHEHAVSARGNCALNLAAEEILPTSCIPAGDETKIWYTFESSSKNFFGNQIHVSAAGHVGGDHAF